MFTNVCYFYFCVGNHHYLQKNMKGKHFELTDGNIILLLTYPSHLMFVQAVLKVNDRFIDFFFILLLLFLFIKQIYLKRY